VCVKNERPASLVSWLDRLRDQRGFKPRLFGEAKRKVTAKASIQGPWTPSFEPPALTARALENSYARLNFRTVQPFDASKHVYPSSSMAATPPPVFERKVKVPKKLTGQERAKLRRDIAERSHQRALDKVNQEHLWAKQIVDQAITAAKK